MGRRELIGGGAFAILALGGGAMTQVGPLLFQHHAAVIFWVGVALAALGTIGLVYLWFTGKRTGGAESVTMGDTYNNSGNNYGHMGPIHIGQRPEFQFTQEHIDQLDAHIPSGAPITIEAVGGRRAAAMGQAMRAALVAKGRSDIRLGHVTIAAPMPEEPLSVIYTGGRYLITLAPSA